MAAGVLVQDKKLDHTRSTSLTNLDFLLSAMRSLSRRHSITHHFIAQLELDIEAAGIRKVHPIERVPGLVRKRPMNGILGTEEGHAMNIEDLTGLPDGTSPGTEPEKYHRIGVTGLTVMPASSRDPLSDAEQQKLWDMGGSQCPPPIDTQSPLIPRFMTVASTATFPSETYINNPHITEFCPYNGTGQSTSPSSNAEHTPPSDSSTPHTVYALRPSPNPVFGGPATVTVDTFQTPSDWSVSYQPNSFNRGHPEGDSISNFVGNHMWGQNG